MNDDYEYTVTFLVVERIKVKAIDELQAEVEAARLLPHPEQVAQVKVSGPNAYDGFFAPDPKWWTDHDLPAPFKFRS